MLNDRCYSLNMMKKILFICDADPFNANMGNAQRTSMMLKTFLNNGFHVDIALIGNPNLSPRPQAGANISIVLWNEGYHWKKNNTPVWKRRLFVNTDESSLELSERIRCIINENNYDFVFCRYIRNALLTGIYHMGQRVILDIDDLPEKCFKTSIQQSENIIKRLYHKYYESRIKKRTKDCIKKSCISFVPNKKEASEYKAIYLPNISSVRKDIFDILTPNHSVLFIGLLSWRPNYEGLDFFIESYWNEIIQQVPDAVLFIAGKGLLNEYVEKWSQYPNIKYLGFVDDIYEFYSKGNVVICPIYAGAGTNIKVIEAMSMGKACVLSSMSTRGYENILKHSHNALIDQDNASFSKHVIKLLKDDSLCAEIAKNAFNTANTYFSQDSIDKIIGSLLR